MKKNCDVQKFPNKLANDFDAVSSALKAISFPVPYNDWARIGLALYDYFGDIGMRLLYEVSCAPFPKYRDETPEKLAAKFRNANGRVSLGTIFHLARQHGWKYERPTKIQSDTWHLVAWHDYTDAQGQFAYRMLRYTSPDGSKKRMTIERYENGVKKFDLPAELRLPYYLPNVSEAIAKGEVIYFVEGESDADALAANGFTATCVPFGANGWNKRYVEYFKGARLCFVPDNDATGKALPLKAIPDLSSVAKELNVIELSDAKDVRELINTKGVEAFLTLSPIGANEYVIKNAYPLQTLHGEPTLEIEDTEDEIESEQLPEVAFPELPNGLFKQVYDYIASFDVPREFALTGTLALLSTVIGDRIGFRFGDSMIFPNEFFIQLGRSGSGKSSTSALVQSLLRKVDEHIIKDGKRSELLYANSATARGLIDQLRHEGDVERAARAAAERAAEKNASKFVPPERTPQTSGLWLIDEFVQLLSSFRREFNVELNSFLLSLWDGRPMSFQTKSDGRFEVPQTSVTILGNSTPKRFLSALPEHARSDGFAQRLLIVRANEARRKTMLQVLSAPKAESDMLCETLLNFFSFCARRPPVKFLPECIEVEKKVLEYQSRDETIDAFCKRLNVRLLKFSLIIQACRAFETRATEIVIDAHIMEHACALLDFFVIHTINFWNESAFDSEKPIDAVGKTKQKILNLLREKFDGEARKKILRDFTNTGNQLFENALAELVESRKVRIEERLNKNNRPVAFVCLAENLTSLTSLTSLAQINKNETKQKQENRGSEVKYFASEVTLETDDKANEPMPTVAPESQPTNPVPPSVPEPKPEPKPEPMPVPESTASDENIVHLILAELPACAIFTRTDVLNAVRKHAQTRVREIGGRLFPAYLLRLGDTDRFVFRNNEKRPIKYKGLIDPNGDGIIPSDSEPF